MNRVLVISGHPNLPQSNTNKLILQQLSKSFDNIEIRKLDELYRNYQIDIAQEQQSLVAADIVILQFPFYWYSMPALLKKWLDDVFSYNFAYGSEGDKLKGKHLILSFTIGGPEASYSSQGYNTYSVEQFLYPLMQTANLSDMRFEDPVYTHGMVYIEGVYNTLEDVEQRARAHAARLINRINELRQEAVSRPKSALPA